MNYPRAVAFSLIAMMLLGLTCIGPVALLNDFAQAWIVSDPAESADAAAVLGGGTPLRPEAAARLYNAGLVAAVTVSTADTTPAGDNPDVDVLVKLGVAPKAISQFGHHPTSTYEEAHALTDWARRYHARQIIIPTETFTSRRVAWIMRRELAKAGAHAAILVLPPQDGGVSPWWLDTTRRNEFAIELLKYVYYRISYALS